MSTIVSKRKSLLIGIVLPIAMLFASCSTSAKFHIPENSQLFLGDRPEPVVIAENGKVSTKPFVWKYIKGIPYRIEQNGQVIAEGTVPAKFRPASIFWPPVAIAYFPVGFGGERDYVLVEGGSEAEADSAADKAPAESSDAAAE